MDIQCTLFVILFTAIFFVLGLLSKLISDFKREVTQKLDKVQESFTDHLISHSRYPPFTSKKTAE